MKVNKYIFKPAAFLLAILLIFSTILSPNSASAKDDSGIQTTADSAILVDAKTGKILYAKNVDKMYPPASMTKMMTEYLVEKAVAEGDLSWDTKVHVSQKVSDISHNREFSNVPLRTDYGYTIKQLYEAMAIYSANGASVALAEAVSGTESKFVDLMNKTAKELGMKNAKFINSTGLGNADLGEHAAQGGPEATNLISARALAKMAFHLVNDYPEALEVSSIPEKDFIAGPGEVVHMVNWNYMLPGFGANMRETKYPGVDGLKTGHTNEAGYCFTGTVKQGDRRFITVVMGIHPPADMSYYDKLNTRFLETKKLFDYGFNFTEEKEIVDEGYTFKDKETLPVTKGTEDSVDIEVKSAITLPIKSGEEKKYKPVLHLDESLLNDDGELVAPIEKGTKVGYVTVEYSGDNKSGYLYKEKKVAVVTTDDVDKANWFILMLRAIGHFFSSIFSGIADFFTGLF